MDYKEKLRLAKEALDSGSYDRETIEYIFPELKESENEDEEVRKILLARMSRWNKEAIKENVEIDIEISRKCIAWLEKQGEKIDAIENFDTEFEKQVSYLIASTINKEHEYNEGFVKWVANALLNYAKHELEKQDEQFTHEGTFVNVDDVREEFIQEVYRILDADSTNDRANQIINAFDSLQTIVIGNQGEQKSKEKTKFYTSMDDLIADALIEEIENSYLDDRGKHNRIVWIKSHRQKPTWSEEDEKHHQGCLNLMKLSLDTKPYPYYNDYLWLKSFKERMKGE